MKINLEPLGGENRPLGALKDIRNQKLNTPFQYADINALLLKQIFVAKEVRFWF